jgi:hypothetical protein
MGEGGKGDYRRARREEYTTPAMRLGLTTAPIRLETICYTNWRTEAFAPEFRGASVA